MKKQWRKYWKSNFSTKVLLTACTTATADESRWQFCIQIKNGKMSVRTSILLRRNRCSHRRINVRWAIRKQTLHVWSQSFQAFSKRRSCAKRARSNGKLVKFCCRNPCLGLRHSSSRRSSKIWPVNHQLYRITHFTIPKVFAISGYKIAKPVQLSLQSLTIRPVIRHTPTIKTTGQKQIKGAKNGKTLQHFKSFFA